jgi:hypothetical protein
MTTQYIGTTERAAIIRKALKVQHGWTSRDVSVRADHFSMGSAIRVRINNPDVSLAAVKAIAEDHEKIDRDQFGEILNGGNRYVTVSYSHDAAEALADRFIAHVNVAVAAREGANDRTLIPIPNTAYLLGLGQNGYGFSLWTNGGHAGEVMDARGAALYVAVGSHNQ